LGESLFTLAALAGRMVIDAVATDGWETAERGYAQLLHSSPGTARGECRTPLRPQPGCAPHPGQDGFRVTVVEDVRDQAKRDDRSRLRALPGRRPPACDAGQPPG
jgi:hypothetical protein